MKPVLTADTFAALAQARGAGAQSLHCSLDLERSSVQVTIGPERWYVGSSAYPYFDEANERAVYYWQDGEFRVASRFSGGLIKLVPTPWGAPTFEIDGIKMLPSAEISPYADAARKVALVEPAGKTILDCCAGLGYYASCCLEGAAAQVHSFEKNADVLWLRGLNPWSPADDLRLTLRHVDVAVAIRELPSQSYDALLHDPPRFAIAGDLYSQVFYNELFRVARRRAPLFHYTGAPNSRARGRDLGAEVMARLRRAGFNVQKRLDGVLGQRP